MEEVQFGFDVQKSNSATYILYVWNYFSAFVPESGDFDININHF